MSLFIKISLGAAIVVAALVFIPLGPDDEAVLSPLKIHRLLQGGEEAETAKPTASRDRVYKWQDAGGQWHFSNQAPAEGQASQVMEIDPSEITTLPAD